jgi:O-antigen/teichoic acid export membrane protein
MGLGIVFTVYMARYLGAQGFGLLSYALAFASVFAIFGDLGLSTLMTREVAREKVLAQKYLGNIISVKLVLVILTFCLIVLAVNLMGYPGQTIKVIYLIALSIIFTTFTQTFNSIFQAFEKMEYQAIGSILSSILMLAGALAVIWLGLGVVEFALIYFASNAVVLAYSLVVCSWKLILPKIQPDINFIKSMVTCAFPFGLSLAAGTVYSNMDAVLLSIMKGNEAVGWYSAAYRLVAVIAVIPGMINLAVFPAMSRFHLSSKLSLEAITEKYFKLMIMMGLPIGVGTLLLSDKIILLFYGQGYVQSTAALQILVWAMIFTFIGAAYVQLFGSTNKQMLVAGLLTVTVFINLGLNLLLIPRLSFIGSGIAEFISEALLVISVLYIVSRIGYRVLTRDILVTTVKVVCACIAMAVFLAIFSSLNIFISFILAAIIYGLSLFIMGGIDREYIDLVKNIFNRGGLTGK